MSQEFDLLIQNGRIVDGTANPYYKADIGVSGGKIRRIAKGIDPNGARRVIDAEGRVVCPGFFDTHSHDDVYLLVCPTCDDKVLQGVTTDVIGNCGHSPAPITDEHRAEITGFLKVMCGGRVRPEDLNVNTFDDYLRRLEGLKPGINVLPLVGHSTVRMCAMGTAHRAPTEAELNHMRDLVAEAMEAGAFGLSTGLIYAPGNYARTEELIELCSIVKRYRGLYASHMRNEGDAQMAAIDEAIRIGAEGGVPVHIAHHKIAGKQNWGMSQQTLRRMAEARGMGLEVTCDQYPYRAGSTFLAAVLPPKALAGGPEAFTKKLQDPSFRSEIARTIEQGNEPEWENLIKGAGFDAIMISVSKHQDYVGQSVADIARLENRDPYDVIFDLVVEESIGVIAILSMMDEEDITRIMRSPWTMIGSDGIPGFGVNRVHPRMTGTFPRVLGRYVRQEGVLTLEEAIRKMTSLPAQTFGVKTRGLLREGYEADIVIFDPETVMDRSTYEEPNVGPEGIQCVLVNGEIAVERGRVTGTTSGKVLRHRGQG